jgi:hypothetical protein
MGVQNVTALNLAVPGLTPNVLTSALTRVAGGSLASHDPLLGRRVASVVTMFAGALFGAWSWPSSIVWPLALCAAVSAVCGLAIAGDESNHSKRISAIMPLSSWFSR